MRQQIQVFICFRNHFNIFSSVSNLYFHFLEPPLVTGFWAVPTIRFNRLELAITFSPSWPSTWCSSGSLTQSPALFVHLCRISRINGFEIVQERDHQPCIMVSDYLKNLSNCIYFFLKVWKCSIDLYQLNTYCAVGTALIGLCHQVIMFGMISFMFQHVSYWNALTLAIKSITANLINLEGIVKIC